MRNVLELIKMQQALGFSSKIEDAFGPFIYRTTPIKASGSETIIIFSNA